MSLQLFLYGKLLGVPDFFESPPAAGLTPEDEEKLLCGRGWWAALLMEVLPRALLAELGLSKMLLGSSGGGQFLLVLPDEFRTQAEEFLATSAADVKRLSDGRLHLIWAFTENLGDWPVVRKRLRESLVLRQGAMDAPSDTSAFEPFEEQNSSNFNVYFRATLASLFIDQKEIGWSPDSPAAVGVGAGKYTWSVGQDTEQVPLTRHIALTDNGQRPATTGELAARSAGARVWGVLRGEVDQVETRFRRAQSIEEHVQLSVLYKQFFAGELEVLCSMPEFWRKVSIVYTGADDFAVYGSWDALIPLARELQRLFRRFSEESLKEYPGGEGKTISMSLALANEPQSGLIEVFRQAGATLKAAQSTSRDCFALLGRILEWRQLNGASELKDTMVRVVYEFGGNRQFLGELAAFYREEVFSPIHVSRKREGELEKPWRLHRRVMRTLPATRDRELDKLRGSLMVELLGKNASQVKLRPAGRVALEWARLLTEA